jgi:hypothetical protein
MPQQQPRLGACAMTRGFLLSTQTLEGDAAALVARSPARQ